MPATLLHITYDAGRQQSEDVLTVMLAGRRPIEETRAIVHRMIAAGDYWAVGEFETSDLDEVWHEAQNGTLSPSWSRQPPKGVRPLGDGTVFGGMGYRSSMVGDIVVVDGHCHVVANTGFQDLGPLPEGVTLETLPRPKDEGRRERKSEPVPEKISGIDFLDDVMVVFLYDERVLQIPVDRFPRLAGATEAERKNYVVSPFGVHWPEVDEDLSTNSLIRLSAEADLPPLPTARP